MNEQKEKPARLIKFMELEPGYAAMFDKEKNILSIDKETFDKAPRYMQTRILFAEATLRWEEKEAGDMWY